eukprot:jgi/Galph1/5109/GphlegSOOS_G3739.1
MICQTLFIGNLFPTSLSYLIGNKDVCVRCWQGNIRKPIRRPISCSKKQDSRIVACKDSSELEPNKEKEETFPTDKSFSIEEANAWYEKEPYPGYHRDMERLGMTPSKQDGPKVGGAKNLYKPDGTPYAPWLIGKVVEDTVNIKFRKKPSVSGKLAADPQLQETSGVGLKARLLGDEVELSWTTEDEGNNVGFVIQRRKGGTEEFQVVCDYRTTPSLRSKGESGGTYSYLDSNVSPGTWIYRLSDINAQGDRNDLSQTLIDIPSNEDKKKQQLALVILLALIISLFVMGLLFDPVGRT